MKTLSICLLVLLLPLLSYSTEISDPFINPLEKIISKEENATAEKNGETANLFIPAIDKDFSRLKVEGIIGVRGEKLLVVKDPEEGEIYMLKEGEAVSPDTKIEKIFHDEVILIKYHKEDKEIKKQFIRLKVGEEE